MALTLDGTAGITYPNSTTQASAGQVLQVVSSVSNTQTSTTSTSPVTSGFSVSITPKFSTSKILVILNCSIGQALNNAYVNVQLWRGGSSIFNFSPVSCYIFTGTSVSQVNMTVSETYLDSPATTSSISYTPYFSASSGATVYFGANNNYSSITLMEIAV